MSFGKRELTGMAKIGIGSARIVGGVMTALGKGLIGTYCRNHQMTQAGVRIAAGSIKGGVEMVRRGFEDLNG
ncbi:MAG TPA: hypothetical protein VMF30_13660 [Pirellulales bacterium]|nr:hypothetical protein [Pirellulales bacterium]